MNNKFTFSLLDFFSTPISRKYNYVWIIFLFISSFTSQAQNAIVGSGFSSGWGSACNNGSNFTYFSSSFGTTYSSAVLAPNGTGNQYWRMGVDWSGTYKQLNNTGSDQAVTPGVKYTLSSNCTGNGAMYRNVSSTSNRYIFKTLNAGTNPTGTWLFFELGGAPVSISSVSQAPTFASVGAGQSTVVTATLSGALPSGQGVYVRYTNNNYSTSTIVEMSGSGNSYSVTLPSSLNTAGSTISYYLITSGSGLTIPSADVDLYTINLNNNGGSNYNYTVQALPTITLGSNPSVCKGATSANLSYTATTNSPSKYSLVFDSTALSAGFANVTNSTLSSSPIAITIPASANAGTYNANLTVITSSGVVSASYPITVTILSLPTSSITANGPTTFCSGGTVNLSASSGSSYLWSTGATTSNINVATAGNYSVRVTAANGCSATSTTTNVIVNSLPTASITANGATTFCSGGSVNLSATSASSYLWSNGATSSSINVSTSGNFSVTVTNANGCSATSAVKNVVVNSLPTATITANGATTFCSGTTTSLTASSASSYLWSTGATTASITPTTTGNYSVTVTDANGCSATSASTSITVLSPTSSSSSVSSCDTYTWPVNGQTYTHSGTYTYIGVNESGCTDTKTLNLTIFASTPSSQTVTACDSYTWSVNGQTYTASGTYVFQGTNAAGCSQDQTLYLTINSSTSSSQDVVACDSYTWSVNGQTYTTSGIYTYTSTNVAGCTDIKTLNLTINSSSSSSQTVVACDSYTWSVNGTTYDQSGTYTYTSTNSSGCTDTKTLYLTINPSTTETTTIAACGTYTWSLNGTTYDQSGTYTTVLGCDTHVLELTITPNTTNSTAITACDSYTWSVDGHTYTTSGSYTFVDGCHTELLDLTINHSSTSSQTVTACDTYTWSVNNQVYTTSGTYTYTSINGLGCTDTKTLVLTINSSTSSTQTVAACGSYTWPVNGQTYTTSGTRTYTSTNASGCTDIKTLLLTIDSINKSSAGSSWVNGQNDNTPGMGAWNLTTNGSSAGFFTASSDVNNGGSSSWGMYASGGSNVASAVRSINLSIGNRLSFSMDNGYIDNGKTVGFGIQNATGENLMELYFIGGEAFYKLNDNAGPTATSIGYTSGGLDISITYTSTNTYSITITTKSGATVTYNARSFITQAGGQKPAQIRFFNAGAGSGPNYDLFFNSLAINNPLISTHPSTSTQNVCVGSTVSTLTVAATGSGLHYQWYKNTSNSYTSSVSIAGATSSSFTPDSSVAGTSYYYCVVTGPCGSTYSNISGAVVVIASPNAGTISGIDTICKNSTTTLTSNGATGGTWSSSDSTVLSVNTSGVVTGVAAGQATIRYTVIGTGGCSNVTATKLITVNSLPTVAITANGATSFCDGGSVNLTATEATSYLWSTGETTQTITVVTSGAYTVQATNENSCHATSSASIISVIPNTTTTTNEITCNQYTWSVNGQTYTESGTYTVVNGCQTSVLNLTINQPTVYYIDADADGYDAGTTSLCSSNPPTGYASTSNGSDCNDSNAAMYTTYSFYVDADGDGYGTGHSVAVCAVDAVTAPVGYSTDNSDCNDSDNTVYTPITYYVDADGDGFGSSVSVSLCSSTAPSGYATNNLDCDDTAYSLTNACSSVLNLKVILQGYYDADAHAMRAVLANEGVGSSDTDVDTISVELHDASGVLISTASGMLQTNGTVSLNFESITGDYYIVVTHRNTVATSSSSLVSFVSGVATNFDFTTADSQAYGDNQVMLETGIYGLYTGDLNQDGFIDVFDFPIYDIDNTDGKSGYYVTDINGDGFIDVFDFPIYDINNLNAVSSYLPY
jgi:hypothetical protein